MTYRPPWARQLVDHLDQLVGPLLHVLLTYLGLRTPPPATARCSICPDLVDLRGPHVVVARQVESQTRSGRIRVHEADVAAVVHCRCAAGESCWCVRRCPRSVPNSSGFGSRCLSSRAPAAS